MEEAAVQTLGKLYGREREVELLHGVLQATLAGRGRLAVVEGEAGIGKSELLRAALTTAGRLGLTVLSGTAHELGQDQPFAALADALDLHALADADRTALAALLSAHSRPEQHLSFEVLEAILGLLEKLALQRPVVLALDDLHWADSASLGALHYLARQAASLPMAVLVTLRPLPRREELERFLRSSSSLDPVELALTPLDAKAVEALIEELIGGVPGTELLRYITGAAGNPLLVRELVLALRGSGALRLVNGTVDLIDASLPSSFRPLVLRRLDGLPAETIQLLRMASILGARFSAVELATVLNEMPSRLMSGLAPALSDGLVGEAGAELAFRHELVRDAIYQDIPLSLKRALHLQVGRALAAAGGPPAIVADHLCLGGESGETEAVQWLNTAAVEAMPMAPVTAVELFDRALTLVGPQDPAREEMLVDRALALLGAGRARDCLAMAREMLPNLTGTAKEARWRHLLANGLMQLGSTGEAADEIETLAGRPGTTDAELCRLLADAALARVLSGDARRAAQLARESTEIAERLGDDFALSQGLSALGMVAYFDARLPEAVELTQRAVALAGRSRDPETPYRPVHLWLGLSLADAERFEESSQVLQIGYRASTESGLAWHQATFHLAAGRSRWLAGEWDDAVAEFETSIALSQELGIGGMAPQLHAYLAYIALQRGDPDGAQAALTSAEQAMLAEGVQFGIQVMLWVRALLLDAAGSTREAFDVLNMAWSLLGNGYPIQYLAMAPDMVRIALAVGDREQARQAVEAVEAAAGNSGLSSARGIALRCRGRLEDDPSILEAAVESLRQGRQRLELAFACEQAGLALSERGPNAKAISLLEEARREYLRVGARLPMSRTTAALRALDVRHREPGLARRPIVGWAALTPTELSVARLVAGGRTSREIGAQLSISRRTVETHLAHIFSKLGISSRVQLAIRYTRERQTTKPAVSEHVASRPASRLP